MSTDTAAREPFPPWGGDREWKEACRSVRYLLQRHPWAQTRVPALAGAIRVSLEKLADDMEYLCRHTCLFCPSPCCLSARPYFDLPDLLVLVFNDIPLPALQTLPRQRATCRYASPRGCLLDRIQRPWICTWYLCPVQKRRLVIEPDRWQNDIAATLAATGRMRKELEEAFIRSTCLPDLSVTGPGGGKVPVP